MPCRTKFGVRLSFGRGKPGEGMKPLYAVSIIILGLPTLLAAQRSPSRPLITGIANVAVYETNLAQSKRFYVGLLGLPESDARTYRVNPLQSVRVDPLPKGAADHLESITFATADVNALRRYLIGRHVVVCEKLRT